MNFFTRCSAWRNKLRSTLRIADNGRGIPAERLSHVGSGLGLRNMQERAEQLDGTLRILSSKTGTVIVAEMPLTHMLTPQEDGPETRRKARA